MCICQGTILNTNFLLNSASPDFICIFLGRQRCMFLIIEHRNALNGKSVTSLRCLQVTGDCVKRRSLMPCFHCPLFACPSQRNENCCQIQCNFCWKHPVAPGCGGVGMLLPTGCFQVPIVPICTCLVLKNMQHNNPM